MPIHPEYLAQCAAVLDALQEAGVPTIPAPAGYDLTMTFLVLRPAFQVLRLPQATQRRLEARLKRQRAYVLRPIGDTGWQAGCLLLRDLCAAGVITKGRHPICIRFTVWHCGVVAALMRTGTYDPASNHTPHPGEELDALERREELRDIWRDAFPALAEAFDHMEDDHAD